MKEDAAPGTPSQVMKNRILCCIVMLATIATVPCVGGGSEKAQAADKTTYLADISALSK